MPANIDFGRSFTFVKEDPDWLKKILIGGAFTLACSLLIGVPFVLGYFSRTLKNVVDGAARPLPEWDDLGGIFGDGLRLTAVYLVHLVGVLAVVALFVAVFLVPTLLSSSSSEHVTRALGPLGALVGVGLYALLMLVSLATAAYVPAALVRSTLVGTIGAGLEWRENVAFIKSNLANYALALVSYLVAAFVAQFGVLLCCVGVFPAAFWSYLVLAMSLGQTSRLAAAS
jgi:Protein of unknown function (DUF4013)